MLFRMDERDKLRQATRRYRRTEKAHDDAREAVVEAVVAALKAGYRPTDVVADSPFTGAHVRKIAREAGIEPRKKGQPPKS